MEILKKSLFQTIEIEKSVKEQVSTILDEVKIIPPSDNDDMI